MHILMYQAGHMPWSCNIAAIQLVPACSTPCVRRIYDALPPESRTGRVQLLLPDGPPNSSSSSSSGIITSRLPLGGGSRQRFSLSSSSSSSSSSRRLDDSALFGDGGCVDAAVLHLAATGDQGFGRRLKLGGPLLAQVGWSWVAGAWAAE
jgi:hypothetical protein